MLTSFHQSPLPLALLMRMAGVPWIGAICEDYPGSLLDLRHRVADGLPESERNLSLAGAAGFLADEMGARLAVRQPLPDVTARVGTEPYVVFHPGAAVPARRPTATHSRAIVAALLSAGHRVVVTGSADEATLTGFVAGGEANDLGGRLSIAELAAVLERADVVVAPNTGPAHLAAAVGTPVVSLFAPVVSASQWAPYGVPRVVLGDQQAPCRDTRMRTCTIPGHPCLTSISPSEVVAAVAELRTHSGASGVHDAVRRRPPQEEGHGCEPRQVWSWSARTSTIWPSLPEMHMRPRPSYTSGASNLRMSSLPAASCSPAATAAAPPKRSISPASCWAASGRSADRSRRSRCPLTRQLSPRSAMTMASKSSLPARCRRTADAAMCWSRYPRAAAARMSLRPRRPGSTWASRSGR